MTAIHRRLVTDRDLEEAMENRSRIRVFEHDQFVHSGGIIIRFDDATVVIQSGASDIFHFSRESCELFQLKRR
jgi:hypothetical protein